MILTENNIKRHIINKVIGEQVEFNLRKPKRRGIGSFFLKSFTSKIKNSEKIKIDSKCNFEEYTNGLLLRLNFSNKLTAIPISKTEINKIELIRGNETIKPIIFSPMWILLKLGVSILIARNFKTHFSEYSIEYGKLSFDTKDYKMEFISNGYLFEKQLKYFESLNYEITYKIKTPVANNA